MEEDGAKASMSPEWVESLERLRRIGEENARVSREWRPRGLEELMPDLHPDEQLRLQKQFRERDRIQSQMQRNPRRLPYKSPKASVYLAVAGRDRHEGVMMPLVLEALRHYNARHPGGEFDPVKPLMSSKVLFRGHAWFHINFWACSRTNPKMIKRFFAEIHQKIITTFTIRERLDHRDFFPVVESCTIIEEPLCQYKRSGFCDAQFDIFHPKGCRKFICGNDKDRFGQRLEPLGCCGNALKRGQT